MQQAMTMLYNTQLALTTVMHYLVASTVVTGVSTDGSSPHPLAHRVPAPLAFALLELSRGRHNNIHHHQLLTLSP